MNRFSGGCVRGNGDIPDIFTFENWTILCLICLALTPGMVGMVFTIPLVMLTNAIVSAVFPSMARWLCHSYYLDEGFVDNPFSLCIDVVKIYLVTLAIYLLYQFVCMFIDKLESKKLLN